jgi:hypothetical protein
VFFRGFFAGCNGVSDSPGGAKVVKLSEPVRESIKRSSTSLSPLWTDCFYGLSLGYEEHTREVRRRVLRLEGVRQICLRHKDLLLAHLLSQQNRSRTGQLQVKAFGHVWLEE